MAARSPTTSSTPNVQATSGATERSVVWIRVSSDDSPREIFMHRSDNRDKRTTDHPVDRRNLLLGGSALAAASALAAGPSIRMAQAQQPPAPAQAGARRPNILVIFGDDIGIPQISAYTMGMMGYRTPNID